MVFKKIINDPYKVVDEMIDGIVLAHHDILKFAIITTGLLFEKMLQ